MASSSRIPGSARGRRTAAWTVVAVVALLVIAVLGDLLAASRAEHRLARALLASPTLDYEPNVMFSGFPFLPSAAGGEYSLVHISAGGAPIEGCADRGHCTATLDAGLHDAVLGTVWEMSAASPISFDRLTAETRIDSVNLGRLLNIVDLYLNTPAPEGKVGGGGPGGTLTERTDGILLSGTVPLPGSPASDGEYPPSADEYRFPKVRVSVAARVELVDGRIRIEATDFYTGPEEHFAADVPAEFGSHVLKLFSTTLPILPLAWDTPATSTFSRGSDLILAGERSAGTVEPRGF